MMKRAVVLVALIIAVGVAVASANRPRKSLRHRILHPVRILPSAYVKPEIVPKGTINPTAAPTAPVVPLPSDFESNGPPAGVNLPSTPIVTPPAVAPLPASFESNGPPASVNLPPGGIPSPAPAIVPMPADFEANGEPAGVNLPAGGIPSPAPAIIPLPADFESNGPPAGVVIPGVAPSTPSTPTPAPATGDLPKDFESNGAPSGLVNLPEKPDAAVPQTMRPTSEMTPTGPVIRGFTPAAVNAPASETSTINLPTQGPLTKAGKNPLVYEVTYVTADGLPAVIDADVKTTDRQMSSKKLNEAWSNIPSAAIENPAARNAASAIVAGIVQPSTTRVLKLGSKAGDNPCVRGGGQCQDGSTCAGTVTKLMCPGPPSIVCCTYATSACTAAKGSCKSRDACPSEKTHKLPGMCGTDADTVCCMTDGGKVQNAAGNCLVNFNPTAFATRAKKYLTEYKAQSSADAVAEAAMKAFGLEPRVTRTDPASLVITALESLGWGCYFNAATGKTVKAMLPVMLAHGGFQPYPKMGDVVMWEESTGIVVQVCVGGKVDVVMMTPSAQTAVIESTGCITLKELQTRDKSSWKGFWTPSA